MHYFLAGILIWEAAPLAALAQQQQGRIENVRVQINGRSSVYIDYDLVGPTDRVYKVTVTMKKESDSTFAYVPQNMAGDIGASVFPGRNNRIVWSLAKEFPEGIKEGEFYFLFTVDEELPSSGVGMPLLIAGGAAVVGGILALILVAKKGSDGGNGGPPGFPNPPDRPR
jgi:hypothetical protein